MRGGGGGKGSSGLGAQDRGLSARVRRVHLLLWLDASHPGSTLAFHLSAPGPSNSSCLDLVCGARQLVMSDVVECA